jgi:hypothetical protein
MDELQHALNLHITELHRGRALSRGPPRSTYVFFFHTLQSPAALTLLPAFPVA